MLKKKSSDEDNKRRRSNSDPLDGLLQGFGPEPNELERLKIELEKAKEQSELQQFQLVNLRRDLEQTRINALVVSLGGAHPEQEKETVPEKESEQEEITEDDLEKYSSFDDPGEKDEYFDALIEWHASAAREEIPVTSEPAATEPEQEKIPGPATEEYNVEGMKLNIETCLGAIAGFDERLKELRQHVKNRDVHIQLLKEKIEINDENIRDKYVTANEYEDLKERLEEYRAVKRTIEMELRIKENVEQLLAEAKEKHEEALKEIEKYRAKIEEMEAARAERNDALEAEWQEREDAAAGELERVNRELEQVSAELARSKDSTERAIAHHTDRLKNEYAEMRALLQQHDESMRRLKEEVERLKKENAGLNSENRELILELNAARRKSETLLVENYAGMKQKLADRFAETASPGALLEMRQFFIETKQYIDAVRTFRQLLVDPKNQKLMPAVCLLVGEFYKLAGRMEEAAFYLANPLIREDSYAKYLMRKIAGKSED